MSAAKWHESPMVAFDTETTGTNPLTDRIVTAAVVHLTPGARPRPIRWLLDPGIPVPDEAAAVHGWTTDRIAEKVARPGWAVRSMIDSTGKPVATRITAEAAVFEIAAQVAGAMGRDEALVVHNAAYDLTLLEAENARHGVPIIGTRPHGITGVVDPMVIEKQFDPYRKVNYADEQGCRKGKHQCSPPCGSKDKRLESLCAHYGIRFGAAAGAHDAADDAIAAARLARKLMEVWPGTARLKLDTLHEHQVDWRRTQADGLRSYFDKNGIEHDGVDGGWPTYTTLPAALRQLVDGRAA
jgi:DNA polymerase-3 subunit epsilon